MLTYEQFVAKHSKSAKWNQLPKEEKKRRYEQYRKSPNPAYAVAPVQQKRTTLQTAFGSGGAVGKTAYSTLCEKLGVKLSPATHDYLTALYNPFCPRVTKAGYPDGAPNGSLKTRAYARFQVFTNAAGFGYVAQNPVACANGSILGISYSSTSAYTGATDQFPGSASGVGQSNIAMSNTPFNSASSGASGLQWRLVSSGIRIRSTQALLSKSGECKAICNPIPDSDLWAVTGPDILGTFFPYAKWYAMNTSDTPWYSAIWSPSAPSAGQFVRVTTPADIPAANVIYDNLGNAASFGASSLGLLIAGAPNAVFNCEVITYYEYFGSALALQGLTTPSYSDPLGASAITSLVAQQSPISIEKSSEGSTTLTGLLDAAEKVGTAMSKMLPMIGGKTDTSSLNGMTATEMASYLPSVPSGGIEAVENLADAPSISGFLSDAAELLPMALAV